MKRGDVVSRKYMVVEALPPGGKSENAMVTCEDSTFFLKKFSSPKYPYDTSKVVASKVDQLKAVCKSFEERHIEILRRLDTPVIGGGNLVKPVDFFREKGSYYKIYPFVQSEPSLTMAKAAPDQRLLFIKTFLLCLRELHAHTIVHSDLKPDNILVERRPIGPVAKLIDFDEAYISGSPPKRSLCGDIAYMSPELAAQIEGRGGDPSELTLKSDMFSAGLVIHQLVTGALPEAEGATGGSHSEVVANGGTLKFASLPGFPPAFGALLRQTSASTPADRPDVDTLLAALGVPNRGGGGVSPPVTAKEPSITMNMGRRRT